ncbi:translation initiation factor IF-2-like [Sciurus carolinensis]|uniref:translation initiation factor IF-2-like n=1 Tax=Sciurus carolinensis TaxID=30640 RepID=UPI001FB550C2|nr:translation initiation factor IF-2-like [Sciurus carolinensis]
MMTTEGRPPWLPSRRAGPLRSRGRGDRTRGLGSGGGGSPLRRGRVPYATLPAGGGPRGGRPDSPVWVGGPLTGRTSETRKSNPSVSLDEGGEDPGPGTWSAAPGWAWCSAFSAPGLRPRGGRGARSWGRRAGSSPQWVWGSAAGPRNGRGVLRFGPGILPGVLEIQPTASAVLGKRSHNEVCGFRQVPVMVAQEGLNPQTISETPMICHGKQQDLLLCLTESWSSARVDFHLYLFSPICLPSQMNGFR